MFFIALKFQFIPQQPKTSDMIKCEHHMRALEFTFGVFKTKKREITSDFEQRIEKMENYIKIIEQHKIVTPKPKVSQVGETSAKKPITQVLDLDNSHFIMPAFQQETNQFITSLPQEDYIEQLGMILRMQLIYTLCMLIQGLIINFFLIIFINQDMEMLNKNNQVVKPHLSLAILKF